MNKSQGLGSTKRKMESESLYSNVVNAIDRFKRSLGLGTPGSYDNLHREVKSMFISCSFEDMLPQMFLVEGSKFDIAAIMSGNLSLVHSFAWGHSINPPAYHFGTNYMDSKVFLVII